MQNDSDVQQAAPGSLNSVAADISFEEVQQAERTIRRLKRGNPVRKLARDVMNRRPVENVQPLLKSLSDPTRPARERQIAAWALGWTSLDAAQKQAATDVLRDVLEEEQAPDSTRFVRALTRVLMLSLPLTLVSMYWTHRVGPYFYYRNLFSLADFMRHDWRWEWAFGQLKQRLLFTTVLASVPVVSLSFSLDRKQNNRVRAATAVALGRMESVESVGALTTALYDHSAAVRRAAVPALKSTLPLLSPEHYGQLGVQAIPNLCRALEHGDELLVLHVLNALEKVGDGRAVRPVEEIATRGRTDRIRQMAIQVLPLLQERQRQENASKMLLRAAMPTESASQTLLRPVSAEPISSLQVSIEAPLPTTGTVSPVTAQPDEQQPQILRLNTSG